MSGSCGSVKFSLIVLVDNKLSQIPKGLALMLVIIRCSLQCGWVTIFTFALVVMSLYGPTVSPYGLVVTPMRASVRPKPLVVALMYSQCNTQCKWPVHQLGGYKSTITIGCCNDVCWWKK